MDLKPFLEQHYEKLVLGGTVVLLGTGFFLSLESSAGEAMGDVQRLLTKIDENNQKSEPKPLPEVTYPTDARRPFEQVADLGEMRPWLFYKRPFIKRIYEPKMMFQSPDPEHHEPNLSFKVTRDGIVLTWMGNAQNSQVTILKWILERREGAEGSFEALKEFDAAAVSRYVDADLKPKRAYFYRVVSEAESEVPDKKLPEDSIRRLSPLAGPAVALSNIEIEIKNVTPGDVLAKEGSDESKDQATLRIHVWDNEKKEFVSHYYPRIFAGEKIGRAEKKGGKVYDFYTGYTLKKVRLDKQEDEISPGVKLAKNKYVIVVVDEQGGENELDSITNKGPDEAEVAEKPDKGKGKGKDADKDKDKDDGKAGGEQAGKGDKPKKSGFFDD